MNTLTYRLGQFRSGCSRPQFLGAADRLQGVAVLEKCHGNIHAHVLFDCANAWDKLWTAVILFDLLDTVPDNSTDPLDDAWRKDMWQMLMQRGWLSQMGRSRTYSPLLYDLAPGGTAMVQVIQTSEDLERVCKYMTKEMIGSSSDLARLNPYWARKADLQFRLLSDFHAPIEKPASRIRIDPRTGCKTLNLDDPHPWKWCGKRLP
jgi:hypothetical protein